MEPLGDPEGPRPSSRGLQRKLGVKRRAVILGVMTAINIFINIVLFRVVERELFLIPRLESCNYLESECGKEGSSQKSTAVSLLRPTWCLHPVSESGHHKRQGEPTKKSCQCARHEPGTEDSSSWRDVLPHLRGTLCLRAALLNLDGDTERERRTLPARRYVTITEQSPRRPYWEVQLLEGGEWEAGIARLYAERIEMFGLFNHDKYWSFRSFDYSDELAWGTLAPLHQDPHQSPVILGLYMDEEEGWLSLYNADTMEHLHTFSPGDFSDRVRPFFRFNGTAVRLL
ncbi:butyrophilin subfamily 2 member A2-like [Ambystoma mexicanum]|uniref:butyrophilin subfamily 2 member A2-like n=1 Tax=Ambystoma mexicanum TaxID=8296 RepID=UPI0037E997A6